MARTVAANKSLRSTARPAGRALFWLASLWLAAALLAAAGVAHAADDPPGRIGRVSESEGQAWVFDAQGNEWIALQRNRPLTSGDRIAVDANGRLELWVGSTTLRLAGGSDLEIRRLDDQRIDLLLHEGSAALRVRSPEVAREVALATDEGRFTPRGPGYFRIDRRDGVSDATAWRGELHFESDDSAMNVDAGRSAQFWREAGVTHYNWSAVQNDEFADWAARAERADERSASARYVSQEMTGWEDLDRNGSWETSVEYGPLWTPTTVVAGWAPYRYGHWAWVRPWGWTWVDDAPWGFAPFHYGRWVMFRGRWCWAPGQWVARPVYAPALVAWIGGPHASLTVSAGAPLVGWVPLAPHEPYYPGYARGRRYWNQVNHAQLKYFAPNTPRVAPPSPVLYVNQRVPNAVSLVPASQLVPNRPMAPVVAQVDPTVRGTVATQPWRTHVPPPGVARPIAVPGAGATTVPRPQPPGPALMGRPPGAPAVPPPPAAVPRAGVPGSAMPEPPPRERIPRRIGPAQMPAQAPAPLQTHRPPPPQTPQRPAQPVPPQPMPPRPMPPQVMPAPPQPPQPTPRRVPAPIVQQAPQAPIAPQRPAVPRHIEPAEPGGLRRDTPGRSSAIGAPQHVALQTPVAEARAPHGHATRRGDAPRAPAARDGRDGRDGRAHVPEPRGERNRLQMR